MTTKESVSPIIADRSLPLRDADPEIFGIIEKEERRQHDKIE